jgi:hypothetical protein
MTHVMKRPTSCAKQICPEIVIRKKRSTCMANHGEARGCFHHMSLPNFEALKTDEVNEMDKNGNNNKLCHEALKQPPRFASCSPQTYPFFSVLLYPSAKFLARNLVSGW